ncbi:MAG: hypothetical protein A2W31_06630 [Planctomycetes bacterium RBG_16_64_10]|nr:MAG: hypothetical protein A2W31_06630 [Planctomycetes bacterium RBG_16_64_10]
MDFKVQCSTHRCASTRRRLNPGEPFCSVLVVEGAEVVRYDYCAAAWQGPPAGALGWWKSRVPTGKPRRAQWAPNDVMLELFDQWDGQPDKEDLRYVLTLLLIRRRVLRLEDSPSDQADPMQLVVYCPRREATYTVPSASLTEARIQEIQEELARLLLGGPQ